MGANPEATQLELRERYQQCVEAFVIRARRVESHSLCQDRDRLLRWARHSFKVEVQSDGHTFVTISLPPEEQLESLATRVRPMILNDDPVFAVTVMNAIGFLLQDAPDEVRAQVKELRKAWLAIDDKSQKIRGYGLQIGNETTGESATLSDNELAFAWIYGDTIHAKAQPLTDTKLFGVANRYEAAVPLVTQLAVRAIMTLNLIRQACDQKYLSVDDQVFIEPVVVTETEIRREGQVYTGPPGTMRPGSIDDCGPLAGEK